MRWLSESVEALIADELSEIHRVVVIGSGYGGAVAALRLAESGHRVLVLERGDEYLPGEFPNDIANLPSHLRLERWNQDKAEGDESGLFDLRIGENAGVLVGNALGGTSQINANVAIEPEPCVYEKHEWPKEWNKGELKDYFDVARRTLEVNPFGRMRVEKHAALRDLSEALKKASSEEQPSCLEGCSVNFSVADIAVNLADSRRSTPGVPTHPCVGCGDCVSGCNHFAKNTLTTNYLAKARVAGAKMFTGATVLDLAKDRDEAGTFWNIRFVRTADRADLRKYKTGSLKLDCVLRARTVILSAGSLGSTEILLRSRNAIENPLDLSGKLGRRFSGNGDYLAFGYLQDRVVQGVGWGSRCDASAPAAPMVGPTITGLIRIDDKRKPRRSTLIEEGSVPGAIARIFHELVTTMAAFSQLASESYRGEGLEHPDVDPLALRPEALTHTQTLLAMGHDRARGRLAYDKDNDRLRIRWPKNEPIYKLHDERLRHVEELGAVYLQNPAWSPLPGRVRKTLSGPVLGDSMFTVHPLGGCPMGDSFDSGVVDGFGAVYDGPGIRHEGLYVLDGSIIPCSLGVNPLLTITALAERAMEKKIVPALSQWSGTAKKDALPGFPRDSVPKQPYANPRGDRLALQFTEVLRGKKLRYRESADAGWELRDASLTLHLPVADLQRFFESPSHPIEILGCRGNDVEGVTARFELGRLAEPDEVETFEVASGTVEIFERETLAGWGRVGALVRVALTWFIERGHDELCRAFEKAAGITLPPVPESKVPSGGAGPLRRVLSVVNKLIDGIEMVRDWLKLAKHAAEIRTFKYRINLTKGGRAFHLEGYKHFEYAASRDALWRFLRDWIASPPGSKTYLQRRNVWTSLGLLEIKLYDEARNPIVDGELTMDLVDMTHRYAAQLEMLRDSATALLAFAGYPLMFLRAMIKTRLWDFRLPDYPELTPAELSCTKTRSPVPEADADPATEWPIFPCLRESAKHGKVFPRKYAERMYAELQVRCSRLDGRTLAVRLTRYAQPRVSWTETGDDMVQIKAVMLMNGFAQPTLPFVAQEIPQNLAEHFYDRGYDVWLFDYRTSTILDSSKEPCTMDDVAEFDVPQAVEFIESELAGELGLDRDKVQIYAFAHCVGSACMAMSMLGGYLRHHGGGSRIAGAIFSQMLPILVGSETAQIRIPLGSVLRDLAGVEVVHLAASEKKPSVFESLLDRVAATLPNADEERCPYENDRVVDRPDIATCKRLAGVISRLFKHGNLLEETHRLLDVYFGRANTTLLVHGTKCLDYARLVNADGQNVYVTDANIQKYFRLPIALLHGRENALFNIESCQRTYEELQRVNGTEFAEQYYRPIPIDGYAHFDCIVGKGADENIFRKLGDFLDDAYQKNSQVSKSGDPAPVGDWKDQATSRVIAPVTGPIIGRVKTDGKTCKVRLWIQVNEYEGDPAWCAITVSRKRESADPPLVQSWPITRIALEQPAQAPNGDEEASIPPGVGYVAIAIADLDLPADAKKGYDIDMVSLHVAPSAVPIPDRENSYDIPKPAEQHKVSAVSRGTFTRSEIKEDPVVGGFAPQQDELRADFSIWIARDVVPLPKSISPALADEMLGVLKRSIRETCKVALRPNPYTLSRRHRALPREDTWTAHIMTQTLAGPGPDGSLRFLAGCCRYPGMTFEGMRADATFKYINDLLSRDKAHRDFIFMLGDQIYADATAGVFDPRSSVEKFRVRYEKAFSSPEFRKLARQLPTYMVIDDHEIDNDWSRDDLAEGPEAERRFLTAMASFAAYQWAHSPRNLSAPGFNYRFESGGYRFLVLDTRTQRERHRPLILAEEQFKLLDQWLAEGGEEDQSPRFLVTGSVLVPGLRSADPKRSDAAVDSWQMAQEDRRRVLTLLLKHKRRNVVFLSGDYHCSATATLKVGEVEIAHAIVAPPFYAPYTYANVPTEKIRSRECIDVGGVCIEVEADATGGNGFADIHVDRLGPARWSLGVSTYALRLEDEKPGFMPYAKAFILS